MADEEETENPETDEVPAAEPEKADPWKERALQAEAQQQQAMAMLQQFVAQQRQPQLQNVEPDFEEAAGRAGMTTDQMRIITGVATAKVAQRLEEHERRFAALQPTVEDKLATVVSRAGYEVDEGDAVAAIYRARKSLGQEAPERQVMDAAVKDLQGRKPTAPDASRTIGVGGASIPRGARRAEAVAPKVETFVDVIKKDQKKRGLYAY